MARRKKQTLERRLLDAWTPPENAGGPVGCVATTFTFHPVFFETECLRAFLSLESDAEDDDLQFLIEQEERMAQLEAVTVLADQQHCTGKRSVRWDLLPARLPGRFMHAKVSLLVWQNALRIIIGSANLTEDGYRRNQEIFGVLDYHEGSESPLQVLEETAGFLSELLDLSVPDADHSPAVRRCRQLLDRTRFPPATWGLSTEQARKAPVRVVPVFSGPGRRSVPEQLAELWPERRRPNCAWVVSPFFDGAGGGADRPSKELWALLHKTEPKLCFGVSAEPNTVDGSFLLHAPESLGRAHSNGAKPTFERIKGDRVLHSKAIWLEGDAYALNLIGSSNFTSRGLGLGPLANLEANLAYVVHSQRHKREYDQLGNCFPHGEPIEGPIHFKGAVPEEEQLPGEECPLPVAFGTAEFDASSGTHGRLILRILEQPPAGWRIRDEEGTFETSSQTCTAAQWPAVLDFDWTCERPPSGLVVEWADTEPRRAWWPVEVRNLKALKPPEKLRNLPLDILIRVLTSAQPLHRVLAAELRRLHAAQSAGSSVECIDPHRKVDVSGFLLQRSRRFSEAIEAICTRLSKLAPSEACFHWRIEGPVGLKSLVAALDREARSPEERAFLLTELVLGLWRLQPEGSPAVPAERVQRILREESEAIRAMVQTENLSQVPKLAEYIEKAFKKAAA